MKIKIEERHVVAAKTELAYPGNFVVHCCPVSQAVREALSAPAMDCITTVGGCVDLWLNMARRSYIINNEDLRMAIRQYTRGSIEFYGVGLEFDLPNEAAAFFRRTPYED